MLVWKHDHERPVDCPMERSRDHEELCRNKKETVARGVVSKSCLQLSISRSRAEIAVIVEPAAMTPQRPRNLQALLKKTGYQNNETYAYQKPSQLS
jgi:hypothetical protein